MNFDWAGYIQTAKAETRERLQALNDGLLRLEVEPGNAEVIHEVFRHAHSIKGAAQMVGLDMVARVAHGLEEVLGAVRARKLEVSAPLLDVAFQTLDAMERLLTEAPGDAVVQSAQALATRLHEIASGSPPALPPSAPAGQIDEAAASPETIGASALVAAPAPESAPMPSGASADAAAPGAHAAPAPAAACETIRVSTGQVDRLLELCGELAGLEQQERVLLERLRKLSADLHRLREGLDRQAAIDPSTATAQTCLDTSSLVRTARRLMTARSLLGRELRDAAMDLRLLPAADLFERFPRPVRDLARVAGKEVRLVIEGEETRLDKRILDGLYDPLLHLIRNAIDHGLETPAERTAAGKPTTGTISLRAVPRGRTVLLQVCDDGRGIDVERVRTAACDRAFLTPSEAASLTDDQLLQQIFRPGFSTAPEVTAVSGRGVGLDVVAQNVRDLKGVVRLETQPGRGTTFTMELPLTLATTRVLLLECGGWAYALPGALVRGALHVAPGEVQRALGQAVVSWEGRTIPLLPLHRILGLDPAPRTGRRPVVLAESGGRVVGLLADALLEEQEAVLKPLDAILRAARLVSAGIVLGDGRLALLLNLDAVVAAGEQARTGALDAVAEPQPARKRWILLADDAFTTREIERAILETAGYEVVAVADGQAALAELARRDFDLVITDIEMPGLDGITLTRTITSNARTAHLPVIIITSLANEEDRRRGLEAGAAAYIVKSAFDQESLLDLVDRLTT